MRYLLGAWDELKQEIDDRPVMLFLDYDGTVTPIVERPELSEFSEESRHFLSDLARIQDVHVALISGRALSDLKERVGLPGVIYAGNHGLELEDSHNLQIHPRALEWERCMHELARALMNEFKPFDGMLVEDKFFTLSVHYRLLDPAKLEHVHRVMMQVLSSREDFSKLIVRGGKKVWEIRPPIAWDKGAAVMWLIEHAEPRAADPFLIYAGDDQTDEDAFKVLKGKGFGVKITRRPRDFSHADFYLCAPEELFEFLKKLSDFKRGKERSHAGF